MALNLQVLIISNKIENTLQMKFQKSEGKNENLKILQRGKQLFTKQELSGFSDLKLMKT